MKNIILSVFTVIAFSGCLFNPDNKDILFLNNKAFYLPIETKQVYVTADMFQEFTSNDIRYCDIGDLFWVSKYDYDALMRQPGNYTLLKEYFNNGLAGCVSAMSEAELEYRLKAIELKIARQRAYNDGINNAVNSWAKAINPSSQTQEQDTLNSINRNLQILNNKLQDQNSKHFYNANPIYPY